VYDQYSLKLLEQFYILISGALFVTYSLYLIFKFNLFVPESVKFYEYIAVFTIPLSLYIIMRFMYLTSAKPNIARSPEKAFRQRYTHCWSYSFRNFIPKLSIVS